MIFDTLYAFFASHAIEIIECITITAINANLLQSYYNVVDLILTNTSLVGLFIRPSTLVSVSISVIAIINFEHITKLAYWVKNRIKPF